MMLKGPGKDPVSAKATILPFQYRDGMELQGERGTKET